MTKLERELALWRSWFFWATRWNASHWIRQRPFREFIFVLEKVTLGKGLASDEATLLSSSSVLPFSSLLFCFYSLLVLLCISSLCFSSSPLLFSSSQQDNTNTLLLVLLQAAWLGSRCLERLLHLWLNSHHFFPTQSIKKKKHIF